MTLGTGPTPRQILRRINTAQLPLPPMAAAHPVPKRLHMPEAHPVKDFWRGSDGFVMAAGVTLGVAGVAAVALPALTFGASMSATYTLATVATSATALSFTGTLIGLWSASDFGHGDLLKQRSLRLMPSIATGIGLGALLGAQAMATVAGVATGGTALLVLGYITAVRTGRVDVSMSAGVGMLAAAMVLGPTGWLVMGGIAAPCALSAAVCLASASTVICAVAYAALRTLQRSPSTELLDRGPEKDQETIGQARLEGSCLGSLPPTIFNVPEEFTELATTLQTLKIKKGAVFNGYNGLCVAPLYGPPGSGKTFSATGLAQALGAMFVVADKASLEIDNVTALPEAYLNLIALLMEAQLKAARHNQPVVVLLDEVDALLPRTDTQNATQAFNNVVGFELVSNVLQLMNAGETNVVLLLGTNHPDKIAALIKRWTNRPFIYMGTPDKESTAKILKTSLTVLQRDLSLYGVPHGEIVTRPEIAGIVDRLHALNLTGRTLKSLRERARRRGIHVGQQLQASKTDPQHIKNAVDDAIIAALLASMVDLEARGSQKELNASYGRLEGQMTLDEIDRFMGELGFNDLDPIETIRRLGEQFLGTYVDPSQSVGLAQLSRRFYMTLLQLTLLYAGQRLSTPERRDIKDVPQAQSQQRKGQKDFQGQVTSILRNTLRDAWGKKAAPAISA